MGCLVPILLAIVTFVAISIPVLTFQAQGAQRAQPEPQLLLAHEASHYDSVEHFHHKQNYIEYCHNHARPSLPLPYHDHHGYCDHHCYHHHHRHHRPHYHCCSTTTTTIITPDAAQVQR